MEFGTFLADTESRGCAKFFEFRERLVGTRRDADEDARMPGLDGRKIVESYGNAIT